MNTMWDERFQREDYVYGEQPNAFLAAQAHLFLSGGEILSLGEGEGRNAVFLAEHGFNVTALDSSKAGFEKLHRLAETRGVRVGEWFADVTEADLGSERWDGIVNIFCHLPSDARPTLYERIKHALKPGGVFLTEQFSTEQLKFSSGGPRLPDMLLETEELHQAFRGFELLQAERSMVQLDEGPFHQGPASVIRFIARKPAVT